MSENKQQENPSNSSAPPNPPALCDGLFEDTRILPEKFQRPELWNYDIKKQNILFTTTSNDYGFYKPTLIEMPKKYYGVNKEFTEHLAKSGVYRNFGLNT